MKNYLMIAVAAASLLSSATSHALVRLVDDCQTQNGQYTIEIMDNEGIGPVRDNTLWGATITDNDSGAVVGTYAVEQEPAHAIGFGDPIVDKATNGRKFSLGQPDTNVRGYSIHAVLDNGVTLSDDDLKCSE